MFAFLRPERLHSGEEPRLVDIQIRFLLDLADRAFGEGFAVFEVASWE